MRLRSPLNGLKLAQGHAIIHFAFFIASLVANKNFYYVPEGSPSGGGPPVPERESGPEQTEEGGFENFDEDVMKLIYLVQIMHVIIGVSIVISWHMEKNGQNINS